MMLMLLLYMTILSMSVESRYSGDSCNDEKGAGGTCIVISSCQPLLDDIRMAGNPMPMYMAKRLQQITCGFHSGEPLVCCVTSVPNSSSNTNEVVIPNRKKPTDSDIWNSSSGSNSLENNSDNKQGNDRGSSGPPDVKGHPNIVLLPTDCGSIESNRIWGGNVTALYEFPWMVLLSYETGRETRLSCGGTIINEWYILTAAHCVEFLNNNMKLVDVILGEYDVRQDPDCEVIGGVQSCAPKTKTVRVEEVIPHVGYRPETLFDDIALIRLSEKADFSLDTIKPICLPVTRDLQKEVLTGLNGIVAGWGVTELGLQSPVLLSVDLPILSNKDCNAVYGGNPRIYETQLCAGGVLNKDSCGGDSGGPLMYPGRVGTGGVRYVQRGIVSFGSKRCGIGGYPGVYTRVAYYMDWILDNIHS